MSNFKIGDTVILEKYGRASDESEDWAKEDELPLNTSLIIRDIHRSGGWLRFVGYHLNHSPSKFTLKTDTMSKHLTGYKLKIPIPGDSRTVGTVVPMTTEEGYYSLMPDFWEPQYKEGEQFKKGDMVFVIPGLNPDTYIVPKESKMGFSDYKSHAGKVYPVGDNIAYPGLVLLVDRNGNSVYYLPEQCARLATAEEIKNKEAVIVNGYQSVYSPGRVAFGCKDFFKSEVQALLKFVSTLDIRVELKIGGTPIIVEMLKTILKNI